MDDLQIFFQIDDSMKIYNMLFCVAHTKIP